VQDFGEVRQKQPKPQSASHPKSLDSSLLLKTPNTAALPEVLTASFPEKGRPWESLTDAEKMPYLQQADAELVKIHHGTGIMPRPRLAEMRAINLYKASPH
jgi:hypothetical protein